MRLDEFCKVLGYFILSIFCFSIPVGLVFSFMFKWHGFIQFLFIAATILDILASVALLYYKGDQE